MESQAMGRDLWTEQLSLPTGHALPLLCLCFVIPLSEKEGRDEIWVRRGQIFSCSELNAMLISIAAVTNYHGRDCLEQRRITSARFWLEV